MKDFITEHQEEQAEVARMEMEQEEKHESYDYITVAIVDIEKAIEDLGSSDTLGVIEILNRAKESLLKARDEAY